MPTYRYRCSTCFSEHEQFNRISECESHAPSCCSKPMAIAPVLCCMVGVQADAHYHCQATGEYITSRRQRAEVMKRGGYVDVGTDAPTAIARIMKEKAERDALAAQLPPPPPGVVDPW